MAVPLLRADPRYYQSAVLAGLLIYGLVGLEFGIGLTEISVTLASALGAQWLATRLWKLPRFDPKSALISALSLCLLFRSNDWRGFVLAAALAIFSKFLLRWQGKHIFNPTNFALVVMVLLLDGRAWLSPGQWGHGALLAFLLGCLGSFVVYRAARSDVTWAFLGFYMLLVFGRALWLGDPLAIPLHMLSNGGLILFAFYMISDPKTTPDSRSGRILFAFLTVALTGLFQFGFYRPRGLFFALFLVSLLTPFLDKLLPARKRVSSRAPSALSAQPALPGVEISLAKDGLCEPSLQLSKNS